MADVERPRLEGTVAVRDGRRLGFAEFGSPHGDAVIWMHGTPGARRQIPIEARIVSCCDAFSAMTTTRPYREAMTVSEALAELRRCSGTQFDPAVSAALADVIDGPR